MVNIYIENKLYFNQSPTLEWQKPHIGPPNENTQINRLIYLGMVRLVGPRPYLKNRKKSLQYAENIKIKFLQRAQPTYRLGMWAIWILWVPRI